MKGFLISSLLLLLAVSAMPSVHATLEAKHGVGVADDNAVAMWYPGKYLRERRASARASGGRYLGGGFGRAGGC